MNLQQYAEWLDKNLSSQSSIPDGTVFYDCKEKPFDLYGLYKPESYGKFLRVPESITKKLPIGMQFFAEEGGGKWFFTENASGSKQAVSFQILRQYVYSKLQWNPYLDLNDLVDEFMVNYYKAGSEKMKEYYEYLRLYYDTKLHQKEVNGEITGVMGHIGFVYGSWYHDFNSLLQMNDILTKAIETVEKAGYDAFTTTKLVNRIKAESMTVRYYLLECCQKDIDALTYTKLVEEFRKDANELEIFSDAEKMCDAWLSAIKG